MKKQTKARQHKIVSCVYCGSKTYKGYSLCAGCTTKRKYVRQFIEAAHRLRRILHDEENTILEITEES